MKPWKRIEPTIVHKVGHRTVVTKTFTYPDGFTDTYDVNEKEGWAGVATIALTPRNEVVVVRQFRPGPEIVMDELPGGNVEEGEELVLEQAARRELQEEVGYAAGSMVYLGKLSYDAHTNGWRHYFIAYDCKPSGKEQKLDATERHEQLSLQKISVSQLLENARQGRMTDPGAVLLAYEQLTKLATVGQS